MMMQAADYISPPRSLNDVSFALLSSRLTCRMDKDTVVKPLM